MNFVISLSLFVNTIFTNLVGCAIIPVTSSKKCPTTRVDAYAFTCALSGWVQAPNTISKTKSSTVDDCAGKCLSNTGCKSFRYVKGISDCYLYYRELDEMNTNYYNFQPGKLFNRNCFSNDCELIASCQAPIEGDCLRTLSYRDRYYGLYEWGHAEYACAYGRTARQYKYNFKQILYPGELTTCETIRKCANQSLTGTFDVHYHIPTDQWVCINYNEFEKAGTYDPVTPNRYKLRNNTVGAGYGYYLNDYYYPD